MSFDLRLTSKRFLTEFIEVYKSHPCLWLIKSKDYSDRAMKTAAYDELVEKLKEVEPEANREAVARKINCIRSCYRKERKKVVASQLSGAEDVYVSKLWYYGLLDFLDEQKCPPKKVNHVEESTQSFEIMDALSPGSVESQAISEHDIDPLQSTSTKRSKIDPVPTKNSVRKRLHSSHLEDEDEYFAKYITLKLKKIKSDQRIFVEKIFSDVLFEAEMGTLNRRCYLLMDEPPQPKIGKPYVVLQNDFE
ncbi:uncharacterized protein LOC143919189 [Arctopsyche grandis]|uniref:uncharacterized protein LOC143919189 n=1 Tax=Arctopsyche grandis TaxID=121162 RepID=UPI00406D9B1B